MGLFARPGGFEPPTCGLEDFVVGGEQVALVPLVYLLLLGGTSEKW